MGSFDECHEELLNTIFMLLSSRDTAKCSIVCKRWKSAANTVNTSCFWFRSAMSQRVRVQDAMEELLEDVLAAPFWPNFAIIFAGAAVDLTRVTPMVKRRLPRDLSLIACKSVGVVGKDVATGLFDEDVTDEISERWTPHAIALSVGRFPGVRVKALGMRLDVLSGQMEDRQLDTFFTAARSLQGQPPTAMLLLTHASILEVHLEKLVDKLKAHCDRESVIGACVFLTHNSIHDLPMQLHRYRQLATNPLQVGASTSRSQLLQDHDFNTENMMCNVAALAFSKDCTGHAYPAKNLKCAVVASVLRTTDLVAVGPVYETSSMEEYYNPFTNRIFVNVRCSLAGEPAPLTRILRELGSLTHVSPVAVGQQEKRYFEFERVAENGDTLRIKNCRRIFLGDFLQFYAPKSSVAIELTDRALSSFARRNQRAKIVAGLMFSTVRYSFCKQIVYAGRNLFNEHFPGVPIAGLTALHLYGPPAFVTCDENPARSIVCMSRLKGVFCSIMLFIFYTD